MSKLSPKTHAIAKSLLLTHEGFKTTEYLCTAGYRTIGVGYNLDAHNGLPKGMTGKYINGKLTISENDVLSLFEISIDDHWTPLIKALPWVNQLDEWRQAALLDMAFMGVEKLLKFKKMLGFLQSGRFAEAAVESLDSKWSHDVDNNIGDGKGRADTISMIIEKGELPTSIKQTYRIPDKELS